jgi:hypothetical protein
MTKETCGTSSILLRSCGALAILGSIAFVLLEGATRFSALIVQLLKADERDLFEPGPPRLRMLDLPFAD